MKKHLAFTLAEVLIALAIIGTIAALTVPSLMTNIDNQTNITKLKKGYAVINQIVGIELGDTGLDCVNAEAFSTQGVTMDAGLPSIIAKNVSGTPINNSTTSWKGSDGLIYKVTPSADVANCTNYNIASPKVCGWVTIVTKGNTDSPANLTQLDDSMNLSGGAGFEVPYYRNGVYYTTSLSEITTTGTDDKNAAARVLMGTIGKKGSHPNPNVTTGS